MNTTLIILASLLALSAAQMTFSDGWEKRSGSRTIDEYAQHYNQQKAARSGRLGFNDIDEIAEAAGVKISKNAPITNCLEEYMAGVRELQAEMMMLQTRFEMCANAVVNPLLPMLHEKTSRTRF